MKIHWYSKKLYENVENKPEKKVNNKEKKKNNQAVGSNLPYFLFLMFQLSIKIHVEKFENKINSWIFPL